MLKIWRFCAVLFTTILFGFSANAAIDCSNSEPEFFATIELKEAAKFEFKISAGGNFCIDWGDDSDIEAIEDKGTTNTAYPHTYSAAGTYTIGISGDAIKYNTGTTTPAITFGYNSTYRKLITSISGSLGAIFPTLSDGSQPRFYQTFYNCSNLTGTLTNDLFDDIYGTTVSNMFRQTFAGCSSLTQELPDALFAGLTGTPAQDSFKDTFAKTNITDNVYASMFGELDIVNGAEEMDGIFDSVDTLETTCPDGSDSIENSLGVTLCSATESTTPTCDDGYWLNGNTCEICPVGSSCENNIKRECDAGTYTDATGQSECAICPEGSYCTGGIKLECVAGTYTDTSRQSECAICPIGSYCVGGIRHTCLNGQFTDTTQRTTCTICPIGSACSNGIRTECQDGQYTNATGQTTCTSCPMGSYCTAGKIKQCVGGTYSDAPGMSACTTCPDGTTSVPGAISVNQCGNTKVLHIGDTATMNLFTVRPEQKPYMVFDINGVQYYGEMSTTQTGITDGSDVKFKILHNDTEYYLHDFSAK